MKRKKLFSILSVVIVMILIFCNTTTSYAGVKIRTPSISGITRSENCIKIKWKKVNGINGYQIQYSTNSKFKKENKSVKIKNAKTVSKKITKLKVAKKYYVRIRTYKGKKYSKWSKVKSIKTPKESKCTKDNIQKEKHCTNNNNHSMSCGNMGRWFNNKKEIELYLKEIDNNYSRKYENGEITYKEYVTKVPYGYECWSCGYCGKWTGNFKYR